MSNDNRWNAIVEYHTDRPSDIFHFEELEELDGLIESGPSWFEITRITIELNAPDKSEGEEAYDYDAARPRLQ